MIKTDNVVYRTRTEEEYNWLLQQLEKADCWWCNEMSATLGKFYFRYLSDTCIWVEDKTITYGEYRYYKNNLQDYSTHELIEVSDIMENEKKTEILDKLESMNEHLKNELKKLEEEDEEFFKIKRVVYTTEVYFE